MSKVEWVITGWLSSGILILAALAVRDRWDGYRARKRIRSFPRIPEWTAEPTAIMVPPRRLPDPWERQLEEISALPTREPRRHA